MFRRLTILVVLGVAVAFGFATLRGPNGIPALREKRKLIQQLEEKNADLAREIEYRRKRINDLEGNSAVQQQEIRKQLHLQKPGETTFILPDTPAAPAK